MRKINENGKEITSEKLESLKENARGILADIRRSLINDYPFYGSVVMNMDIVPTRDVRNPTAACDGKTIFFDIDFLSSLTPDNQKFVFAHECLHAIMNHMLRSDGRDHHMFNIAADMEVNQLLIKDGFSAPSSAVLPRIKMLPDDLSCEEYYELLLQDKSENDKKKSENGKGGNSSMSMPGFGDPEEDDSSDDGSGNKEGKLEGQFDKHLSKSSSIFSESVPDNICDKYGKVGIDKDFHPEVTESNAEKMREAAIAAAQVYERSRGELPAHLKKLVGDLTTPEISWKDTLQAFITRTIGDDADWNRPNRRFVGSGVYLPSRTGEKVNVGVIIDTSGSTAQDIPKFLGEVNGLVKTFSDYTLTIVQCDTEVNSCDTYTDEDPLDLENTKFNVNGGGGTVIYPAFKHIEDNDIEVDCIVCFTDGYTEEFTEDMDPGVPTLWMISKGGCKDNFKFGEVCELKD